MEQYVIVYTVVTFGQISQQYKSATLANSDIFVLQWHVGIDDFIPVDDSPMNIGKVFTETSYIAVYGWLWKIAHHLLFWIDVSIHFFDSFFDFLLYNFCLNVVYCICLILMIKIID